VTQKLITHQRRNGPLSPLSSSRTQACDQADRSDLNYSAVAAGEGVMLDPRAWYRGGLAGWIPPWRYSFAGRCTKGSIGRVVRWARKAVRSPKSGELGFASVVEPEPE
jgi:hypothetical protein